jgi:hypothetical protein
MNEKTYNKVALAFKYGGRVTVYHADAFLNLPRGTLLRDCKQGRIKCYTIQYGKNETARRIVDTKDVLDLYPIGNDPSTPLNPMAEATTAA